MTRRSAAGLLFALFAFALGRGSNAAGAALERLFPLRAEIAGADRPGLWRVPLGADVLSACGPDLADLRVIDPAGRELPYVLDGGVEPAIAAPGDSVDATVIDVERSESRTDGGPPIYRERFAVEVPETTSAGSRTSLVMVTESPDFVRRVQIDRAEAGDVATEPLWKGSFFRIGAERGPTREKLVAELPRSLPRRMSVTIEGEGGYLEPHLQFVTSTEPSPSERLVVPLAEISRQTEGGRTVVVLSRPRGIVPDRLRVETTTPLFQRKLAVRDLGPGATAELLAVDTVTRAEGDGAIEILELPLGRGAGDRFEVEIDDGDSPPLEELRFVAVLVQPSLLLWLTPARPGNPSATVLFGGRRARHPEYDLAALRTPPVGVAQPGHEEVRIPPTRLGPEGRPRTQPQVRLRERGRATLGEVRPNPLFEPGPLLAFAMMPAAKVDRRSFARRRVLAVDPSPDGLSRLVLEPEDLAAARSDLGDLRIVDGEGRQWPYLLERDAESREASLSIEAVEDRRISRYRLQAPVLLRSGHLVVESDAPLLDRDFALIKPDTSGRGEPGIVIVKGSLRRSPGDRRQISLEFPPTEWIALDLLVENRDEAPLDLRAVRTLVRLPAVHLVAPAGTYELLLGAPEQTAPRYAAETERALVLAVESTAARMGTLEANPDFSAPAIAASRPGATVDPRLYSHRRTLGLAPPASGLVRLRLSPEDLGVARDDLADLRVVDTESRQWPYLLERDATRETIEVETNGALREGRQSRYRLGLPVGTSRLDQVQLDAEAEVVDRAYRLVVVSPGPLSRSEKVLASGRFRRTPGSRQPFTISFSPQPFSGLDLVIDDGDEAPLRIHDIRGRSLVTTLLLAAPAGQYRLLVGQADDAAPEYELAALQGRLSGQEVGVVHPGPLESNPDFELGARLTTGSTGQRTLVWLVLGVAVVALGLLTLRLARQTDSRRA